MSKILVVIPHDRFRDEEFEAVKNILQSAGHEISVGSSHHSEARGHFGLLVNPDINVKYVEPEDYDALVFIGGMGVEEYLLDPSITSIVRRFHDSLKVVAAIGMAVEILIYAGILSGRRVTCDSKTLPKVQSTGAYYTGMLAETDGNVITGCGINGKDEFAQEIKRSLVDVGGRRGVTIARTS